VCESFRSGGRAKAQPVDVLGLRHGHVGQVLGAEVPCECAGAARRSTAAGGAWCMCV
jgi:hypothetical protein